MFQGMRSVWLFLAIVMAVAAGNNRAWSQQVTPPAVSRTEDGLKTAAPCISICASGRGGRISDPEEKRKYQQCVLERRCTSEGPSRPVAREPPEKLLNRPLDILKGVTPGGRV